MKILELFCGYGTASFALKQLKIHYECVGYSDIDKYANQCFKQNHGGKELGDVTNINPNDLDDFDLLTGGFPCQAFSVAGKGLGELDTRGTLFKEIIRIAEVKKPRYMMLENVKGLMSKRHKATFDKIISELYRIGYFVRWKVMNTKEHGIPQNRERVFFICFKSWTDFCNYRWPENEELKIFLKDILEEEVDEKYYLTKEQLDKIINLTFNSRKALFQTDNKIIQINNPKHSNNRVYSDKGISPTLRDMSAGGNRQPFIAASRGRNVETPSDMHQGIKTEQRLEPRTDGASNTISTVQKDNYVCVKNATKKGYIEGYEGDGISLEHPNSKTRRGRIQNQIAPTLQCKGARGVITKNLTIRKLTPKECFRLQGFLNDEINLEGLSNTQQYKLAGNGQSVNVVKKIFERMFSQLDKNGT